jgi:uncharacterized protein (DUF362 family)
MRNMSDIYFAETSNREVFVNKIMKIFGAQLDQAKRIFIKPNIVSSEPYPTTTHPQTLDSLLDHISDRKIVVGDGHAVDTGYAKSIMANSPLAQICSRHNVEFVDLYNKKMKKWTSPRDYTIKISSLPLEFDFIISLPVLKVHKQCGISGALKNQFGYLSKLDRILMHAKIKNLHKGIAEVNVACPTNLFIVDAVETLTKAQECRHGGCPAKLGTMIAGVDPVNLDSFGQKLLQKVDSNLEQDIKHLKYAQQYGIGKKDYNIIKI